MFNRILFLLVSAAVIINGPGTCLAESAKYTELNSDQLEKELTADQQGETKEDRDLTQKILSAIIKDKSLSTYSHNVKVITVDGMVTLKGHVRSGDEKRTVEEKAARIAGKNKIKSEIEVGP